MKRPCEKIMPIEETRARRDGRRALAELAQRVAQGDDEAFEVLHRRFAAGLESFLRRRTGAEGELLEELAQRTWVEVWRALRAGKYEPGRASLSTFLYAIGTKIALRHLETSRREIDRSTRLERTLLGGVQDGADPAELLHFQALLEGLRNCLRTRSTGNALREEERQIISRIAGGASERDLARSFGIAPSTLHAWKRSALEKLRRCLAAKGFRSSGGVADMRGTAP